MSALNKKSFLTYLKEGGIYVVLLVLLAIIIFQDPTFLSLLNLSNILNKNIKSRQLKFCRDFFTISKKRQLPIMLRAVFSISDYWIKDSPRI